MRAVLPNGGVVEYDFYYRDGDASCVISTSELEKNTSVMFCSGTVHRYYKDPDNRRVARKYAFTKAIKDFNREERAALWNHFKQHCRY